jgi:hypothetical protein
VVAVAGFHHHRQADVLRDLPGFLRAGNHLTLGHWHAAGAQQGFGEVFVTHDVLGNGAGELGLGGPDAALVRAVAELHQVAVVQPQVGNAARGGGRHDGSGRRPEPA